MTHRENKELINKLLNLYTLSQALSSVKPQELFEIKNNPNLSAEMVQFHYKMIEKQSLMNSHFHSARLFKIYYDDIKREVRKSRN